MKLSCHVLSWFVRVTLYERAETATGGLHAFDDAVSSGLIGPCSEVTVTHSSIRTTVLPQIVNRFCFQAGLKTAIRYGIMMMPKLGYWYH